MIGVDWLPLGPSMANTSDPSTKACTGILFRLPNHRFTTIGRWDYSTLYDKKLSYCVYSLSVDGKVPITSSSKLTSIEQTNIPSACWLRLKEPLGQSISRLRRFLPRSLLVEFPMFSRPETNWVSSLRCLNPRLRIECANGNSMWSHWCIRRGRWSVRSGRVISKFISLANICRKTDLIWRCSLWLLPWIVPQILHGRFLLFLIKIWKCSVE